MMKTVLFTTLLFGAVQASASVARVEDYQGTNTRTNLNGEKKHDANAAISFIYFSKSDGTCDDTLFLASNRDFMQGGDHFLTVYEDPRPVARGVKYRTTAYRNSIRQFSGDMIFTGRPCEWTIIDYNQMENSLRFGFPVKYFGTWGIIRTGERPRFFRRRTFVRSSNGEFVATDVGEQFLTGVRSMSRREALLRYTDGLIE